VADPGRSTRSFAAILVVLIPALTRRLPDEAQLHVVLLGFGCQPPNDSLAPRELRSRQIRPGLRVAIRTIVG